MKKHWNKMFSNCPFCRTTVFLAGPRGGLSQNFKCKNCGATFNNVGPFGIELLSKPQPKLTGGMTELPYRRPA